MSGRDSRFILRITGRLLRRLIGLLVIRYDIFVLGRGTCDVTLLTDFRILSFMRIGRFCELRRFLINFMDGLFSFNGLRLLIGRRYRIAFCYQRLKSFLMTCHVTLSNLRRFFPIRINVMRFVVSVRHFLGLLTGRAGNDRRFATANICKSDC